MKRTLLYPGTFDPITHGHADLLQRALGLFDEVIIGVAESPTKQPLFSLKERIEMIQTLFQDHPDRARINVLGFHGLLVAFAKQSGAHAILRGIRAVTDFDYEFQLSGMNRQLDPSIETLFLMPSEQYMYISSSLVKEVAQLGGSIEAFVDKTVATKLTNKLR